MKSPNNYSSLLLAGSWLLVRDDGETIFVPFSDAVLRADPEIPQAVFADRGYQTAWQAVGNGEAGEYAIPHPLQAAGERAYPQRAFAILEEALNVVISK